MEKKTMTHLKTLYAEKHKCGAVTIYHNKETATIACVFENDRASKPSKRNKYFTLNCWRYKLQWLN
jgi:hypothetical protein